MKEVNWVGTSCAAKQLHEILLKDDSPGGAKRFVDNFEKECLTWSKLIHPHIVQFLGIYFLSGSCIPMLILEKMDTSLRHYLESHTSGNFLLPNKIHVLRQVAQALSYLHRAMDPSKMSRKSSVKGTLAFMSPDALVDPPKYDEKLDVFSYGNVIITMVTHEWPNPGPPTKSKGGKIIGFSEIQRREQYLHYFTPTESELFLPIVRGCLENLPKDHPTSIQLVTQMREIESSLPRKTAEPPITARGSQELSAREKAFEQEKERFRQVEARLHQKVDQPHLRLRAQQEEIDNLKKPSSPVIEVCFVYML